MVGRLADRVERSGGVCLPDAELAALDVALGVVAHVQTEDGLLQLRLLDLSAYLGTAGLAVLAGPLDRAADDLPGDVRRSAEELGVSPVRLLERLHDRMGTARRERRGVHIPQRRERVIEEAVGAHQDDAPLARRTELLSERLALRR